MELHISVVHMREIHFRTSVWTRNRKIRLQFTRLLSFPAGTVMCKVPCADSAEVMDGLCLSEMGMSAFV